jgi:hypothetical protein
MIDLMQTKPLTILMEKEMSRKEFLLYTGLILLAVTGVSGVWKNLSTVINGKKQKGFGSGPYGL